MSISAQVADDLKSFLLAAFIKKEAPDLIGDKTSSTKSSSSSNQTKQQKDDIKKPLSAQEKEKRKKRLETEFDRQFRITKRIPGGYATFDDSHPDPGCLYEVEELHNHVCPIYIDREKTITVSVRPLPGFG
jgi:hypothetical protein